LYQLWVREFGTNNLPDCSNMCHEASGRALTAAIGTGKGTVDLGDWEAADAIWLMGDNAATNAPRMLTWLAEADRRGAELVHINPLIEAASRRTIVPHEFTDMATFRTTKIGTRNVQVRIGGDMALLRGVAKTVFETAAVNPAVLDGCAILAGLAQATLPGSNTPWQWYADDYDRIRDTMAQVLDGFEDFNNRCATRMASASASPPARERGFLTPSGRAEFGLAPLPDDAIPGEGRLMLATVRSHDQFNTTIYSNDDRCRGLKGLRTVVFMNEADMRERGLGEFDLVDITSFSRDGSQRAVYGYRAIRYEIPRGCAAGYMPELNVLCGIADYSTQSGQPITKHLEVEIIPHQLGQ
jgi:anaerobic selenocysteine-containing dehydrogenase